MNDVTVEARGSKWVWFDVNPAEFRGMSHDDIVAALFETAYEHEDLDYDHDNFTDAADEILAALARE